MSLNRYVRQLNPIKENKVNYVDKIQLVEGSTEAAKEMEFVLVHAAGGEQLSKYKNLKPYAAKNGFDDPLDLGKKIIDDIGLTNKGGYMSETGKITTKTWSDGTPQWLGGNKTPKTDIVLGNKKVSLKKGSSQLMSGGPAESLSTFRTAMEKTTNFNLDALAKEVEEGIKNLLPSTVSDFMGGADLQKTGGTVYKNTKQKKGKIGYVAPNTFDKNTVLKNADLHNQKLKKQFAQMFSKNVEFKRNFVFEAMTGQVKFDNGGGAADWFLVVDFDGSSDFHKVTSPTDSYVGQILSKVKPDVKFKSTAVKKKIDGKDTKTGYYRFWSTVGLGYKAAVKNLKNSYDMYEQGVLLQEGFFNRVKQIFRKFTAFLSRLFSMVKDFITKSAQNMMDFLGLVPVIKFNNDVDW